jgi:hypothetical protein
MGWRIVNTDPGPEDQDWSRIVFHTEVAARSHARFLNTEEERKHGRV